VVGSVRQGLPAVARADRLSAAANGSASASARASEKLHYLPEAHTDFLLAVLGEELGFAGVALVVALLRWIVARAFAIGSQATQRDATSPRSPRRASASGSASRRFINMASTWACFRPRA
jgi:hypothetical protein